MIQFCTEKLKSSVLGLGLIAVCIQFSRWLSTRLEFFCCYLWCTVCDLSCTPTQRAVPWQECMSSWVFCKGSGHLASGRMGASRREELSSPFGVFRCLLNPVFSPALVFLILLVRFGCATDLGDWSGGVVLSRDCLEQRPGCELGSSGPDFSHLSCFSDSLTPSVVAGV